MADNNDIQQKKSIADLYKALMEEHYKNVAEVCHKLQEGPLQRISLHNDTVLHMAAHSKQKDLVLDLLNMLPEDLNHRLADIKKNDGNTILHEVATSNAMISVVEELLRRDENLLFACNDLGEKPIFCAARYGQIEMFEFLAEKMGVEGQSPEESKGHLQRKDGTTVLHISIATECFDLASLIAKHYPNLIEERDQSSITALQYLACNPTVFRKKKPQIKRGFIEQLSRSENETKQGSTGETFTMCLINLFYNQLIRRGGMTTFARRDSLEELVTLLVQKETSWDVSINSQAVGLGERKKEPETEAHFSKLSQIKEGQNSQESSTSKYKKSDESPLFLATMSDIKQIVKVVLSYQPQALEHTNKEGMNILHVAIIYRRIDIFDMVVKFELLAKKLLSATNNEGNSVLHMVSKKRRSQASEKMQSPALQLRDELLLFEKVKSACKMHFSNPLNKDHQTAEELFATTNEHLHQEAKEWLMRTTENCTILSVFIATVAFATAYTVPGGPNQDTGIPILNYEPFFVVFILADMISLTLALSSVGIFFSILTSSFPLEDFKSYLFKKLIRGITCMILSVAMMAVAFGATIVLTYSPKSVAWAVVSFLPVPIFVLSYSPLRSVLLGSCGEWLKSFALNLLFLVFLLFLYVLFVIPCGAFKGLRWTVKKAYEFIICKPVRWICGNKSDTQSPQPTTQV